MSPATALVATSVPVATETPAAAPTQVVEKLRTQVIEKVAEKQVTPTAVPANPYRPDDLLKLSDALKAATKDCKPPSGAKYALLTNAVAPFWTVAQTGARRVSNEIGVPITFKAPHRGLQACRAAVHAGDLRQR